MSSLLIQILIILVALHVGSSQFLDLFPSSRTGDHQSCFLPCDSGPSPSAYNTVEFNEAHAALIENNATDAQVSLVLRTICSQANKTYTCMEEAAKNCTPGMVPLYAGERKFFKTICADPQLNSHYRNIFTCSLVVEFGQMWGTTMTEPLNLSSSADIEELYHNASYTAYGLCAAAEKLPEKVHEMNVTGQCGADAAASHTYWVDNAIAAYCLSENVDNGASNVTFGMSAVLFLLSAFLFIKHPE